MSDDELTSYLDLDEEELQIALGAALLGAGRGFSAQDEERFRRQGEKWFSSRLDEIRRRLCPNMKTFYADGSDRITDTSAVVDALAAMAGHPVPTIVAALAVKYGLRGLCRDYH